jgi:hypothetical protein
MCASTTSTASAARSCAASLVFANTRKPRRNNSAAKAGGPQTRRAPIVRLVNVDGRLAGELNEHLSARGPEGAHEAASAQRPQSRASSCSALGAEEDPCHHRQSHPRAASRSSWWKFQSGQTKAPSSAAVALCPSPRRRRRCRPWFMSDSDGASGYEGSAPLLPSSTLLVTPHACNFQLPAQGRPRWRGVARPFYTKRHALMQPRAAAVAATTERAPSGALSRSSTRARPWQTRPSAASQERSCRGWSTDSACSTLKTMH